jgi:Proteasome subunit
VVPLFAGYDLRRAKGRIFTYDPTGGRYEETDYHADGSGGRDARTTIKLGFRENMSRSDGIELCVRALWQAADEDSATGGPDAVRGIYPTVATITARGFERVPEGEVAEAFNRVIANLSAAEFAAPPAGPTDARAGASAIPATGPAPGPGPAPGLGSGASTGASTGDASTGDASRGEGGRAPGAPGSPGEAPPAGLGSLQKGLWP